MARDHLQIGARPTQVPARPRSPAKSKVLIAKNLPPDPEGKELDLLDSLFDNSLDANRPVPLRLLTAKSHGPRRSNTGNILSYSILGNSDDFEHMEKQVEHHHKEDGRRSRAATKTPSVLTESKSLDDQIEEARSELASRQKVDEQIRTHLLSQMKIFQKYREIRQENALRNWKRHAVEWQKIEQGLAGKVGKNPGDLLMARLGEYRAIVEERDLIEEALNLIERRNVGFWSQGLRIGNDLLGLTVTMPKGGPREIERLRGFDANKVFQASEKYKENFDYREMKKRELKHVISLLDPFHSHDDGSYLEVKGQSIAAPSMSSLRIEFVDRISERVKLRYSDSRPQTAGQESALEMYQTKEDPSPKIILGTSRLSFETKLGEVATSILTVYNKGKTAVFFEWQETKRENKVGVKSAYDNVQRFFVRHRKGVIHPGEAYDFPVIFRSLNPGIFTEVWTLRTSPEAANCSLNVTLQGYAIEGDTFGRTREKIQQDLSHRVALTVVQDIVETILGNVKSREEAALPSKKKVLSDEEDVFVERNKEYHLYYSPPIFAKFLLLAVDVHSHGKAIVSAQSIAKSWDRSVISLHDQIYQIQELDARSALLSRLNALVEQSSFPPAEMRTSLLLSIGYDVVLDLAHSVASTSETIRKRLGVPLQRSCVTKFRDGDTAFNDAELETLGMEQSRSKMAMADDNKGAKGKKEEKPTIAPAKKDDLKAKLPAAKGTLAPSVTKDKKKTESTDSEDQSYADSRSQFRASQFSSKDRWTADRHKLEKLYKQEFKSTVRSLVIDSINRMSGLFEDADSSS